uniref:Phospholipase B1, membrane-associated n=1 Tax=Fundulus heteroclitus TaxID=8078 RepID=A0A3Q2QY80_FUNHE
MAEMKRINRELQIETEKLVYGGRYDGREDFAVVVQPFFRNSIVPLNAEGLPDTTFFSEDCFHFSERGHAGMAAALWNNMLEPVGKKQSYNNFTNARNILKCPTEVRQLLTPSGHRPGMACRRADHCWPSDGLRRHLAPPLPQTQEKQEEDNG